jgi:sugar-phosphatase
VGFLALTAAAALFDMDGTLVDSTAVVESLWGDFCRTHGVDPGVLIPWSHGRRTPDTVRHFLPDLADAEVQAVVEEFERREETTMTGIVDVPGARALLETIEVPWAVVTSAPRELACRRMAAAGLPPAPVLVPADEIERGKPDPEGYLRAAALLDVRPEECAAFEDAEPGLRSALASGARCVVVGGLESPYAEGLARVPDLTAVRVSTPGPEGPTRGPFDASTPG